ncbi:MAG TPA: SGNH/GDSL hydrolase family protein [Bryobacteraceae bacterium]|nr:SGNH/GDSL hydrolase family protein [Bryobacteraceae bacterium]
MKLVSNRRRLLQTLVAAQAGFAAAPAKHDWRKTPFRTAVAFGESTTAGGSATTRNLSWVNRLADLINEAQLEPVKMINSGLGANLISPRSSYYEQSGKPAAMLRYQKQVIEHRPDLVLVSFGLNDARAGTPVGQFIEDLRHIVVDIKAKTGAVVVVLNAYFMTDFDRYDPFKLGSVASFKAYNAAEEDLARECGVLYADVFDAEGMAPWTIDPDGVHANNLGHRLVANKVFETLAKNCSCLAESSIEARKTFKPWRDESVLKKLY